MLQGRLAQSIFSLSACFSNEGKTVLCKGTMVRAFKSKSGGCNFFSGATESNNWILASYAQNSPADATIRSLPASIQACQNRQTSGSRIGLKKYPNQTDGIVCIDSLIRRLEESRRPALVCMIAASNESGIVQPWEKVAKLCQERNVPFHCDTTQCR